MRDADLTLSRRRFLLTSVKAGAAVAAALVVGPEVFAQWGRIQARIADSYFTILGVDHASGTLTVQWNDPAPDIAKMRITDYTGTLRVGARMYAG